MKKEYEPQKSTEILGNQPSIAILGKWLKTYDKDFKNFKNKKTKKFDRAAMISGPVGIGHSLIVKLLAKENGYRVITFDCTMCKGTRPKNKESDRTQDFTAYISEIQVSKTLLKKIILFDTGDAINGTMSKELVKLVKKSQIPIIINCNDPYSLKTLANSCLHIKLKRPTKIQIVNYLVSKKLVKSSEKEDALTHIETQGSDVRHILNSYIYGVKPSKDINGQLNLFSATEKIFNSDSLKEKEEAFWQDYAMIPMMVQQNYINNSKKFDDYDISKKSIVIKNLADSSEALSEYAVADRNTGPNSWAMLPVNGYLVIRAVYLSKRKLGFPGPRFPESLGRGSSQRSHIEKIALKAKLQKVTTNSYRMDFLPYIYSTFMKFLQSGESEDMLKAIIFLKNNNLTRDDFFDLIEKISFKKIDLESKKKSAFTRAYNKYYK